MDPANWAWSLGFLVQQRAARETAEQRWEKRGSRVTAAAGAGRAWRGGMGCGAKRREGVEKKMRQNPESTSHGCGYQYVPAMVLPSAKRENPNEGGTQNVGIRQSRRLGWRFVDIQLRLPPSKTNRALLVQGSGIPRKRRTGSSRYCPAPLRSRCGTPLGDLLGPWLIGCRFPLPATVTPPPARPKGHHFNPNHSFESMRAARFGSVSHVAE